MIDLLPADLDVLARGGVTPENAEAMLLCGLRVYDAKHCETRPDALPTRRLLAREHLPSPQLPHAALLEVLRGVQSVRLIEFSPMP